MWKSNNSASKYLFPGDDFFPGTLHAALLMGKADGPVQVHFFGQVQFHNSDVLYSLFLLLQLDNLSLSRLKLSSNSNPPLSSQAWILATFGQPGKMLCYCLQKPIFSCLTLSHFSSLEVLVGRTDWDTGQKEVLLPKIDFMNRFE